MKRLRVSIVHCKEAWERQPFVRVDESVTSGLWIEIPPSESVGRFHGRVCAALRAAGVGVQSRPYIGWLRQPPQGRRKPAD